MWDRSVNNTIIWQIGISQLTVPCLAFALKIHDTNCVALEVYVFNQKSPVLTVFHTERQCRGCRPEYLIVWFGKLDGLMLHVGFLDRYVVD